MSAAKRGKKTAIALPAEPRVQLLPSWLAEREKRRQARSLVGLCTVLALVVAGAATGGAYVVAMNAEGELANAQAETASIQAQQLQYTAGAVAAGAVADLTEAISVVGATDIEWGTVFGQVQDALPPEAVIVGFSLVNRAPWELRGTPDESPLRGEVEAAMEVVVASPQVLNAVDFDRMLRAAVPSYADSVILSSEFKEERVQFETKLQVTFNVGVLSHRYDAERIEEVLGHNWVEARVDTVGALHAELERLRTERLKVWDERGPILDGHVNGDQEPGAPQVEAEAEGQE